MFDSVCFFFVFVFFFGGGDAVYKYTYSLTHIVEPEKLLVRWKLQRLQTTKKKKKKEENLLSNITTNVNVQNDSQ